MRASYIENLEKWVEEFSFYTEVRVRFSETDMYGHVNNTVPFTYFELARIEYLKHFQQQGSTLMAAKDEIIIVADLQCDFIKQCYFDELLHVYVKAASIGTSSIDLHYMVKNEKGDVCYTGRGTIVLYNAQTGKSVPISEQDKQLLLGKYVDAQQG